MFFLVAGIFFSGLSFTLSLNPTAPSSLWSFSRTAGVTWPAAQRHPNTTTTEALLSALATREAAYRVLSDDIVYDRYARVYSRRVRFPDGKEFAFDVWGRVWRNDSFAVVIAVPFDRKTSTLTLVREYNVAHARFVYSFPQGCVERHKHSSVRAAAAAELEEEAHLRCNDWRPLLDQQPQRGNRQQRGAPQDKYQREAVHYFLCTEAVQVGDAGDAGGVDQEEDMDIVRGVTIDQFRELVAAGVLQSNNIAAGFMAMDKLRRLGHLP